MKHLYILTLLLGLSISMFSKNMPDSLDVLTEQVLLRRDTITQIIHFKIFYPVGQTGISPDYMTNAKSLQKIRDYLRFYPRIDSMVIYSYASPEGSFELNRQLAEKRGRSAKEYILQHVLERKFMDESLIFLKPDAENWAGLREMVDSCYRRKDREEVLRILDGDETNERKKVLLKRLDRGRSWQYIIKNIMPELRYATWISVWQYVPVEKRKMNLSVELPKQHVVIPSIPLPPPVMEETDTKTVLALKTNLLYDAVSWLNFSIEVPLGDRFSVLYYHQFPWWRWGKGNNEFCMRFLSIGAEGRWWFKRDRLTGWFAGLYVESGKWDFERKQDICYQGEHWSTGVSIGYAMPIGKRLNLEFSLSAGYASIPYRGYQPSEDYEMLIRDPEKEGRWNYFGPTKAQVSLVLPFTVKYKKGGRP